MAGIVQEVIVHDEDDLTGLYKDKEGNFFIVTKDSELTRIRDNRRHYMLTSVKHMSTLRVMTDSLNNFIRLAVGTKFIYTQD